MKKNAIKEFEVWTIFLAIGVAILATEVVVKAMRPSLPINGETEINGLWPIAQVRQPLADIPEARVAELLVESIVQVESGGRATLVGSKGERGLMQVMESTWKETTRRRFGREVSFSRAFDASLNREVGTAYLSHLHQFLQTNRDRWQADERSLLLACYNAGPQRVASANFDLRRLPASTQDYVTRASSLHDVFLKEAAMALAPGQGRGVMQIVQLRPTSDI